MPTQYKMPALCLRDSRTVISNVQIVQQPTSPGFTPSCIAFCFATRSADDPYVGPGNLAHPIPPLPKHKIIFQRRKLVDVQHLMGHQAQLLPILGVIVQHCLSPFQRARWRRWRISGGNQTKKKRQHKTKTEKTIRQEKLLTNKYFTDK